MHEGFDVLESVAERSDGRLTDEGAARAARRDRTAFILLYDRYAERVERYVLARVANRHDAEDIVSATFLQALARIETFDPARGSFAGWLFAIARNAANMHHRTVSRTVSRGAAPQSVDPSDTLEEMAVLGEQARLVRVAMQRLTPEQRNALALRYLADLPFADIARQLGKSEGATKMLVRRAIEALRTHVKDGE